MKGALALVGFMGAGKSTVGSLVAGRLGTPLVDTDALVVAGHGSIERIFAERGEQWFRDVERDIVCEALTDPDGGARVVALGGGAVMSDEVREALSRLAHVVWLDAPIEVLFGRARSGRRPLAGNLESFTGLYLERRPLYEAVATAVVACGPADDADVVCEAVLAAVAPC